MKHLFTRILWVTIATAASVWFIPGLDDAVDVVFQIVVLIASS